MNDVVNPNPFYYAEQIDWCALLSITVFRTTATRFYAYLIYITHVPYIMMAVRQTPFNYCFRRDLVSPNIKSGFDQSSDCDYRGSLRSTIIFTFSIIPYLILFVKHYFRNQHPDCNTSHK